MSVVSLVRALGSARLPLAVTIYCASQKDD